MASYIFVNTSSGNGLEPIWCQTISQTNDDLLSIGLSETISLLIFFIEENVFESDV